MNWKTATLFHRTEKLHKITDKTTNVSRRYNSSSSGIKCKHRVESIGSLKTGNNGKINAANVRNQKIHPFTAKRISLLVVPKDKSSDEEKSGVVYRYPCNGCDKVYIGETKRSLGDPIKEHCAKTTSNQSA